MAGSERSGIEAADANLFQGATCIVTPTPRTPPSALAQVIRLWRSVGSRVVRLTPRRHDAWVAQISHLPHLVAVGLALTPSRPALKLSAGGFADTTRIALSDPALWSEICSTNRSEIRKALARFLSQMKALESLLASADADGPLSLKFRLAQRRRRQVVSRGGRP
jgi:prephenate dehydrogenase